MHPIPRLSCDQCRRRKTKCDKAVPCSSCKQANLVCDVVQRARRPRGRSGKQRTKATLLESRVSRMEDILKNLHVLQAGQRPRNFNSTPSSLVSTINHLGHVSVSPHPIGNSEAISASTSMVPLGDFWSALSQEVAGLRDILESSEDDEFDGIPKTTTSTSISNPCQGQSQGHLDDPAAASIFSYTTTGTISSPLTKGIPRIPDDISGILLDIYRIRVDSVYKILHMPSTIAQIRLFHDSTGSTSNSSSSLQALEFAIYYMSLCTITDVESQERLKFSNREDLLHQCRTSTEYFLQKANLLRDPSMKSLQAFVIYILAIQTNVSRAASWSLVSLAIRLGKALHLDRDQNPPPPLPGTTARVYLPFEIQERRRLWFSIGIIDTQTALDRGSLPLFSSSDVQTPPLNIDDAEMTDLSETTPQGEGIRRRDPGEFTEMSFSSLTHEAMVCHLKLCEIPNWIGSEPNRQGWDEKLRIVKAFETSMASKFCRVRENAAATTEASPLEKLAETAAHDISCSMYLLLWRPPYHCHLPQHKHDGTSTTRTTTTITGSGGNSMIPPWHKDLCTNTDFDVLTSATEVMGGHLQTKSVEFSPWAWKVWDKWYALAVVLAELCAAPFGPKSDWAFEVAERYFDRYSHLVADPDSSRSWRPVGKLMTRVRSLRSNHDHIQNSNSNSNSNTPPPRPFRSAWRRRDDDDDNDNHNHLNQLGPLRTTAAPTSIVSNGSVEIPITVPSPSPSTPDQNQDQNQDQTYQRKPTPTADFNPSDDIPWLNWTLFLEDMNGPLVLDPL